MWYKGKGQEWNIVYGEYDAVGREWERSDWERLLGLLPFLFTYLWTVS